MILSAIVAMSENRVIGQNNQLPWKISEDLKHFKKITSGHPIIMGRKTYESIGRLLPDRENVIISRQPDFKVPGARMARSLDEALRPYNGEEVFIIGGAQIYRLALPLLDRIYLTEVHKTISGDAFFPKIPKEEFEESEREDFHSAPIPFSFVTLQRKKRI